MFKENELDVLESIAYQLKRIADAFEERNKRDNVSSWIEPENEDD